MVALILVKKIPPIKCCRERKEEIKRSREGNKEGRQEKEEKQRKALGWWKGALRGDRRERSRMEGRGGRGGDSSQVEE